MKALSNYIRSVGTPTLYRTGSSVYFQGEIPRYAVFILDGIIKTYVISETGDETIVNLYGKGSILPIAWLNNQSNTALFNYTAVSDTRVIKITKDDLLSGLESDRKIEQDYLELLGKSQATMLLRITGLCQSKAIDKICYTLYYLIFRYGLEKSPGIFMIDLRLTQSMLASLIGQTRESTAKNLKFLKDAGVVDYTSSTYEVNKPKLEAFVGEDSFRSLHLKSRLRNSSCCPTLNNH